jgi:hypothetical protein
VVSGLDPGPGLVGRSDSRARRPPGTGSRRPGLGCCGRGGRPRFSPAGRGCSRSCSWWCWCCWCCWCCRWWLRLGSSTRSGPPAWSCRAVRSGRASWGMAPQAPTGSRRRGRAVPGRGRTARAGRIHRRSVGHGA